ncbi:MAG TPA: Teichoic acid linkage unit synthesis [Elusimicrobia bacterium]|nr:Teichoic acid linkage unit synthesis [Elusimicrobiota bacterium]
MATPPVRGMGVSCTLRAEGRSSAPIFKASQALAGASKNTADMAIRKR